MKHCDSNFVVVNEDSLIQILFWLPVVSLLRFKSVCKSWHTDTHNQRKKECFYRESNQRPLALQDEASTTRPLLPSPRATFPSTTKHTTTTNQLGGIPLMFRISSSRGINIFTVSSDDEFEDLGTPPPPYYNREQDDSHFNNFLGIPPPPPWTKKYVYYPFTSVTVVGCSNGIICLHNGGSCNDISLWNPAIKQCRFLPTPFPLEEGKRRDHLNDYYDNNNDDVDDFVSYFVGFGFDVKTKDDYKVLQITSFKPDYKEDKNVDGEEREYRYAREVQVYSLITDSWKRCKDISTTLSNLIMHGDYWNQGHYLNGTYLFIAGYLYDEEEEEEEEEEGQEATNSSRRKCFKPVIMSFDFTEENFRTIQFPSDCKKNKTGGDHKYLILFGEKIAFTNVCEVRSANGSYSARLDIWVLNESWSKFYTFTSKSRPQFITNNGEFILLDGANHCLQLLNLVTGEIKDLQCDLQGSSERNGVHISRIGVYKPSLVPIAGYGTCNR